MNLLRIETFTSRTPETGVTEAHQQGALTTHSGGLTDVAYRVPWRVISREPSRSVVIHNDGGERLTFVRFAVAGSGSLSLSLPQHVEPGESLGAELKWPYGAADTLITVRWFRPNRREYLWVLST